MEYTEREIRKTAQNLAHALTIIEGKKCSVHGFEFLQDSTVLAEFHISVGGVDYDGGSYEVMENGEIRNIAIRKSPSYATVGDGADAIVKRIVGEDLMGEESPLRNPLRENEVPFAKLFMDAESVKPTITDYKLIKNQEIDLEQMEITVDYQGMPYSGILDGGYWRAETFDVEFNEWADQEMLTHGQDISFRDWAKDEGKKHGNVPITDWAEHEEESHDERYGAETFGAESKKTKYGMIAAGIITAFALLPEIKKRF